MTLPHDCVYAEAVLLGESPSPAGMQTDFDAGVSSCEACADLAASLAEVDDLAASLPDLEMPEELSKRTLEAVLAEMAPSSTAPVRRPVRQKWPFAMIAGGLAAAMALIVAWPGAPAPAPPDRLVARGSGAALPTVALKVAVDEGSGLERHRRDAAYPSGTKVQFRVALDRPADVALVRVDGSGAEVVTTATLTAGDFDLQMGAHPLAWQVEPGESDARFVILAAPEGQLPKDPTGIVSVDPATVSQPSGSVCAGVGHLGCDERLLRVQP